MCRGGEIGGELVGKWWGKVGKLWSTVRFGVVTSPDVLAVADALAVAGPAVWVMHSCG